MQKVDKLKLINNKLYLQLFTKRTLTIKTEIILYIRHHFTIRNSTNFDYYKEY